MFAGTVVRCDDIDVDAAIGFVHRRILDDGERWADALTAVVLEFIGRVNGRRGDENGSAHEQKSEHDVIFRPAVNECEKIISKLGEEMNCLFARRKFRSTRHGQKKNRKEVR